MLIDSRSLLWSQNRGCTNSPASRPCPLVRWLQAACVLMILLTALTAGALPAAASHIKGGILNVNITADGRLQGTLTFIQLGGAALNSTITVTPPLGSSQSFAVTLVQTRQYGSTYYSAGTFDQDLATLLGAPPPNGNYTITHGASAVVGGIQNYAGGLASEVATVNWTSGTAASGPQIGYTPSLPISIGNLYSQNLLATGTGLVYTSMANAANNASTVGLPGTTSDVIAIDNTGQITIPVNVTSGFTNGQYYAYNVQVTDAAGNYTWDTVVMQATTDQPPTFTAPTSTSFQVPAGGSLTIPLSATGALQGDTVQLFSATLPSWITFSQTTGNPATGSFVINPPANTTPQTLQLGCDAVATSQTNPLTRSLTLNLQVTPATPTITSLNPNSAFVGDSISIVGTNFTGATSVMFGSATATFTVVDDTHITATVPAGAGTNVVVTTPAGSSAPATFTLPASSITSFNPTSGVAGVTTVTIDGTNFTGATRVSFGGVATSTFTIVSNTRITLTLPADAASGRVSVTVPGGTADSSSLNPSDFTVIGAPTITSFSPPSGVIGATVTITGTTFTGATSVQFGGVAAASFTVDSDTSITVTVPSGASNGPISVLGVAGTAVSADSFTVIGAPTISSFTPDAGAAGAAVTVTGTGFVGATSVTIGGTAVSSFTVLDDTHISLVAGAGTTGPVVVTTPGGTATSATDFTFAAATVTVTVPGTSTIPVQLVAGQSGAAGTCTIQNNDPADEVLTAVTIAFSDPSLFTSATLTLTTADGTTVSVTATPSASTVFTLAQPLTIPAGTNVTLSLQVTTASTTSATMLADLGSWPQGGARSAISGAVAASMMMLAILLLLRPEGAVGLRVRAGRMGGLILVMACLTLSLSGCGGGGDNNKGGGPSTGIRSAVQVNKTSQIDVTGISATSRSGSPVTFTGLPARLSVVTVDR